MRGKRLPRGVGKGIAKGEGGRDRVGEGWRKKMQDFKVISFPHFIS